MNVVVNGSATELPAGTTVTRLLELLELRIGSVVVEHNGMALLRSEVLVAQLADGDKVELVRAVAGG